jgi:hypothetical protein
VLAASLIRAIMAWSKDLSTFSKARRDYTTHQPRRQPTSYLLAMRNSNLAVCSCSDSPSVAYFTCDRAVTCQSFYELLIVPQITLACLNRFPRNLVRLYAIRRCSRITLFNFPQLITRMWCMLKFVTRGSLSAMTSLHMIVCSDRWRHRPWCYLSVTTKSNHDK